MSGVKQASLKRLALVVGAVALMLAVLPFVKGALVLRMHEGDALHLSDIVLRMAMQGQVPHLDFMTPIGILAVWPIALFAKLDLGLGHAFFAAQALVAALLFGPVLWVARSRFPGHFALLYAVYIMLLCLTLVHAEAKVLTSVSMHYNRWAWALAYVALPLAIMNPLGRSRPLLEGALIGLALAGLVLIKVTYFVALLPAILVGLVMRRAWGSLFAGAIAGLLVAAFVTLAYGADFWLAYMRDLLAVATSETRSQPGLSFQENATAPPYLLGSLAALGLVVLLRQSGRMTEGLAMLLLLPGAIYITYQNWGNDPQWLVLAGVMAFALRPSDERKNALGWPLGGALAICGVVLLSLASPSAFNLLHSPIAAFKAKPHGELPMVRKRSVDDDLLVEPDRLIGVRLAIRGDAPGQPYEAYAEMAKAKPEPDEEGEDKKDDEPALLNGEELPSCEVNSGHYAVFDLMAKDLTEAGYAGQSILVGDLFTSLWLFGDFKPVEGAAPWYYSGTPGVAAADRIVLLQCAFARDRRNAMIKALAKEGWQLEEERRTETYIVLRPIKGQPSSDG
ncbi:glycosyltransferase family 87 protein [Sedimentimonas flavescens]|uniref:glycosyltransferase family 87 protein n=1 Tax=Sedimentimonas flavescens TaxID=2851012 RepID=UPI0021A8D39B|nr:glycosyltransferase family 87 protein [Sedimentimonas flavescens]MCT2539367.1 DUF2029 domain-containing protein [Sedimentimonas flavescens]